MGLKQWAIDKIIASQIKKIKENLMFKKLKALFIGDNSKKRYVVAIYVAIRGAYEALYSQGIVSFPWPHYVDTLASAFGIWAAGDALKKIHEA